MKIKNNLLFSALVASYFAAALLTTNTAHADSATWTGAVDGTWSNVNNWAGPPAAVPGAGQIATFDIGSAGGVIDLGAGVSISRLNMNASAPTLTIGAGAVNSQTLALTNSGFALAGSGSSTGTLTINSALSIGSGAVFQSISHATVNIEGNLTTHAASGTTTLRMNDSGISLNGVISNGGTALLGLQMQQNNFTLGNANNTFTGGMQLDNATVNVGSISMSGLPSAAGAGGTIGFGNVFGYGSLNYTGTASTTDRNLSITHGLHGGRIIQSGTGHLEFTSDVTSVGLSGSATLQLQGNTAGTGEISGSISDHATIGSTNGRDTFANGATTMRLYSVEGIEIGAAVSGSAFIQPGTTVTAINTATRTITLSQATSGGNIAQNTSITIDGVYNPTSVAKSGSGTWVLSGANTHSGTTSVTGGFLTLANSLALQNSTLDTAASVAGNATRGLQTTVTTLTIGGLSGNKDLKSVFQTDVTAGGYNSITALTLNPGTDKTRTYSGAIVDGAVGMTVTKTGAGTQILSGISSYTGATTVSAGTLFVSGALTGSNVIVEMNGTIGSNGADGTLGNGLTIAAGGTLDLTGATLGADSTGILSITGGSLTLGALSFQDIVGWDWENAAPGTYELIDGAFSVDFGSTLYVSEATAYDFGNGNKGYFTSGSLNAVIIPEPSTILLGALGVLALLRRRRA